MTQNQKDKKQFEVFHGLEEGEKILFNDRKTPLTVQKIKEDEMEVQGPQGGEYLLYTEEDAKHPLVAKPGSKKYSSYAKNVRKVGKWQKKQEKTWQHTKTRAKIIVKKNQVGFWTLETQRFDENLDIPKYGFSSKERAEVEVQKVLQDNPEG